MQNNEHKKNSNSKPHTITTISKLLQINYMLCVIIFHYVVLIKLTQEMMQFGDHFLLKDSPRDRLQMMMGFETFAMKGRIIFDSVFLVRPLHFTVYCLAQRKFNIFFLLKQNGTLRRYIKCWTKAIPTRLSTNLLFLTLRRPVAIHNHLQSKRIDWSPRSSAR